MHHALEQRIRTDHRIKHVARLLRREPWLRVKDLARLTNLSPSRLQHLFKETTGVTIGAFTKQVQIARAKKLLVRTHRPLKEIGKSVGITDPANLGRYFKQYSGYTPAQYRRRFQRLSR